MSSDRRQLLSVTALAAHDRRYQPDAYLFVLAALDRAVQCAGTDVGQHVSGGALLTAFRVLALEQFGPLARPVLAAWGLRATVDVGHVVFGLAEARLLNLRPEDSLADFTEVYDFAAAFEQPFMPAGLPIKPPLIV